MERTIDIYTAKLGDPKLGMAVLSLRDQRRSFSFPFLEIMPLTKGFPDTKTKANVATEVRDSIESLCSPATYPKFLSKLWPVFKKVLQGEPEFRATHAEHVGTRDIQPKY